MTVVDLNIDAEILSDHEVAPRAAVKEAAPTTAKCHFCSDTFDGPARFFTRGRHEKSAHKEEWEKSKVPGAKKATRAKKATKAPATAKKSTTVTSPGKKRISAAEALATNIGRIAKVLGPVDMTLSRALVFSAPATGAALDEFVAGTVVDRMVVQKVATVSEKWERLGGVIAFPVLVALISRNPNLYPALESELRDATLDVLIANIPTLEKQKAREAKAIAALRRLGQIDERFATSEDPIGLILRDLFAQPETVEDGPTL
jgi:hypothetical protein